MLAVDFFLIWLLGNYMVWCFALSLSGRLYSRELGQDPRLSWVGPRPMNRHGLSAPSSAVLSLLPLISIACSLLPFPVSLRATLSLSLSAVLIYSYISFCLFSALLSVLSLNTDYLPFLPLILSFGSVLTLHVCLLNPRSITI